jgi:hypothetical protein
LHGKDCAGVRVKLFSIAVEFRFEGDGMPDVLRAMMISGSILIAVVIFIIIISFVTVRRGEQAMAEDAKQHGGSAHH